jgi:hypothetical protein
MGVGNVTWFDGHSGHLRRVAYRGRLCRPGLRLAYGFDGWKRPLAEAPFEDVEPGLAVSAPIDVHGHLVIDCFVWADDTWDNNAGADYRLWVDLDPLDSHLHCDGQGPGPLGQANLETAMASAGVRTGVVSWPHNLRPPTTGLHALVWVRPGVTPVDDVAARLADGFAGLKLHPTLDGYRADDRRLDPYLDAAAEAGRPVACHSAPGDADPRYISRLAERHPDVPLILYHTYLGPADGRRRAVGHALRLRNLYLETSWCRWEVVARFVDRLGPDRVLFGSDASVDGPHHYRRQPPNVEGRETYNDGLLNLVSKLGPDAAQAVTGGNARRIFGL